MTCRAECCVPGCRDDRYDDVELASIYPADEDAWAHNRTIACTIDAASGRLTGSALRSACEA